MSKNRIVRLVKRSGYGDGHYGVHEIENDPHQGSGIFSGTIEDCLEYIRKNDMMLHCTDDDEPVFDESSPTLKQMLEEKKELEYKIMGMLNQFQNKYWVDIDKVDLDQFQSPSRMDPCKRILNKVNIKLDL